MLVLTRNTPSKPRKKPEEGKIKERDDRSSHLNFEIFLSADFRIIEAFVAKGIPLGTAIAFMMAVVGLSLPEATLLKKVMTWRLIGIFFGTVTLFIILLGYLFNLIL